MESAGRLRSGVGLLLTATVFMGCRKCIEGAGGCRLKMKVQMNEAFDLEQAVAIQVLEEEAQVVLYTGSCSEEREVDDDLRCRPSGWLQ